MFNSIKNFYLNRDYIENKEILKTEDIIDNISKKRIKEYFENFSECIKTLEIKNICLLQNNKTDDLILLDLELNTKVCKIFNDLNMEYELPTIQKEVGDKLCDFLLTHIKRDETKLSHFSKQNTKLLVFINKDKNNIFNFRSINKIETNQFIYQISVFQKTKKDIQKFLNNIDFINLDNLEKDFYDLYFKLPRKIIRKAEIIDLKQVEEKEYINMLNQDDIKISFKEYNDLYSYIFQLYNLNPIDSNDLNINLQKEQIKTSEQISYVDKKIYFSLIILINSIIRNEFIICDISLNVYNIALITLQISYGFNKKTYFYKYENTEEFNYFKYKLDRYGYEFKRIF